MARRSISALLIACGTAEGWAAARFTAHPPELRVSPPLMMPLLGRFRSKRSAGDEALPMISVGDALPKVDVECLLFSVDGERREIRARPTLPTCEGTPP